MSYVPLNPRFIVARCRRIFKGSHIVVVRGFCRSRCGYCLDRRTSFHSAFAELSLLEANLKERYRNEASNGFPNARVVVLCCPINRTRTVVCVIQKVQTRALSQWIGRWMDRSCREGNPRGLLRDLLLVNSNLKKMNNRISEQDQNFFPPEL